MLNKVLVIHGPRESLQAVLEQLMLTLAYAPILQDPVYVALNLGGHSELDAFTKELADEDLEGPENEFDGVEDE